MLVNLYIKYVIKEKFLISILWQKRKLINLRLYLHLRRSKIHKLSNYACPDLTCPRDHDGLDEEV